MILDKILIFLGLKEGCPCCDDGSCQCSDDCENCDCGSTKNAEDQENLSGGGSSVNHLNPTEVHGAQDIMGAESAHGRVFGSRIGAYNYNVPVGSPAFAVPPNPRSYQTPSGLYHDTYMMDYNGDLRPAYGAVWDNWNDTLPEYRFPRPWSPAFTLDGLVALLITKCNKFLRVVARCKTINSRMKNDSVWLSIW